VVEEVSDGDGRLVRRDLGEVEPDVIVQSSRARRTTTAAVNCFETEPVRKIVSGVIEIPWSRLAIP
jgi:hypothetical protein